MTDTVKELLEKRFLEISAFGVAVINSDFEFIEYNSVFEKIYPNLKEKGFEGFSRQLVTNEGIPNFNDVFELKKELVTFKSEFDKKNKIIHQVVYLLPLVEDNGEVNFAVCLIIDTSDSNQWQKEFNLLFERVPNLIAILDKDFNIIRANERFRDSFGESGPTFEQYKKKHSETKNTPVASCFVDGDEYFASQFHITKSGDKSHFIVSASPFSTNGKGEVTRVLEISTDITEINHLQEQLHNAHDFYADIIESSADAIIGIGRKGKTQIFNLSARNIFNWQHSRKPGISKIQEMLPKEFFSTPDINGKIIINKELNITTDDGLKVPVRINAFELTNKKNSVGRVAFLQDLRKIKALEEQKRTAEKMAMEQSFKALEESIRSLLEVQKSSLDSYQEALKSNDADFKEISLEYLVQRHSIVNTVVNSFLDVLIGYGKTNSNVNYADLIESNIQKIIKIADYNQIKIIKKIKSNSKSICLDAKSLNTIILVLLANAVDESAKSGKEKTIIIEADELPNKIFLRVTDSGQIIPPELFEKLFIVKDSKIARIGLVTVNLLVKALNGSIEASSNLKEGNSFTVILPTKDEISE